MPSDPFSPLVTNSLHQICLKHLEQFWSPTSDRQASHSMYPSLNPSPGLQGCQEPPRNPTHTHTLCPPLRFGRQLSYQINGMKPWPSLLRRAQPSCSNYFPQALTWPQLSSAHSPTPAGGSQPPQWGRFLKGVQLPTHPYNTAEKGMASAASTAQG